MGTDDHRFRELLSGARCTTPEKGYTADCTQRNECARADLMDAKACYCLSNESSSSLGPPCSCRNASVLLR